MSTVEIVANDREPWEKQPGESRQAFAAFAMYRDLGFTRSLAKAAQALLETQPGRKGKPESVKTQMSQWSVKWGWQARCEAYDLASDRRQRAQLESDAMEAARRQAQIGVALQSVVAMRMRGNPDEGVARLDPNEITWQDVATLTRTGVNVERLARGLPTDLLARAQSITPAQHMEVVTRIIDEAALPLIPEELQDRFWQLIERIASGRS